MSAVLSLLHLLVKINAWFLSCIIKSEQLILLISCSGDKRGSWAPPVAHTGREMLAPPSAHNKRDSVARDHLAVPVGSHREYHIPQQGGHMSLYKGIQL